MPNQFVKTITTTELLTVYPEPGWESNEVIALLQKRAAWLVLSATNCSIWNSYDIFTCVVPGTKQLNHVSGLTQMIARVIITNQNELEDFQEVTAANKNPAEG